jgi:Zn-dependent M28 family amino/carboxypeptidase
MRGFSSVIMWSLVLGCGVGGEAASQFNGTVALSYVEAQLGFGPRVPNTEGHRRTGDWILEQLAARADTVEVQAFSHVTVDGDTLQLRNLLARFEPDSTNRILYLAHWDTRPHADASANLAEQRMPVPGANDGASGVAILLGVADELYREPPAYGVDLLFVDGEDYGDFTGPDVLMGSRYFAANLPEGYMPLFAVLFDMVGDRDLQIPQEGHSVTGAPEVVDRVWRQAQELGYGRVFQSRVGMSVTDDHIPLQETGIRAIDVIDFTYPYHHTIEDTFDKVSARSLEIVGNVAVSLVR